MGFTADIVGTNTGVTKDGFVPLSVTASQVTVTGSTNNLMGFMTDILSCQSRKSTGENNKINEGCFSLRELVS